MSAGPLTPPTPFIYIIIISNPNRQHSKVLYRSGCQEKRKTREIRSEEKAVGFSSVTQFLARKREAVTGLDQGERPPYVGAGIVMARRTGETVGSFQIHSRKTRMARARAL